MIGLAATLWQHCPEMTQRRCIETTARGRVVLRLLLMKHQINLLCIPALFIQLLIVANQSGRLPSLVCFSVEVIDMIASTNCAFSGFLVAFGR